MIKCKKCGCKDFHYVEGIKGRRIKKKLGLILLILLCFMLSLYVEEPLSTICIYICAFTTLALIIYIIYVRIDRSKTHTKVICKKCNSKYWLK